MKRRRLLTSMAVLLGVTIGSLLFSGGTPPFMASACCSETHQMGKD